MEKLIIRDIADGDIDQVIALWQMAGVARPWNDPAKDIAFARREEHSTVLIGENSGRIIASAMVGEDGHRGWVYYVATLPDLQRSGAGRQMMGAAEAWLIARGIWKVQLLVRGDNQQAGRFYERLGYQDTKTVCFQKVLQS